MEMLDESLKHTSNKTVGLKQTKRALEKGLIQKVYLAKDADAHVLRPIMELSKQNHVEMTEVPTMVELGKACGIEVGAAVVGILK